MNTEPFIGQTFVFGIPAEQGLLIDAPRGRRRFRFRQDAVGEVFIKTWNVAKNQREIRRFRLSLPDGLAGAWGLVEIGRNVTEL